MHGLSPFSNKFLNKFFCKIVPVLELQLVDVLKMGLLNLLGFLHFESFLYCITVSV